MTFDASYTDSKKLTCVIVIPAKGVNPRYSTLLTCCCNKTHENY